MRKGSILVTAILLVVALPAAADAGDGEKHRLPVFNFVRKIGTFIDSMTVRGLDRRYIDAPKKPWQIILQGNVNQSDLKMKTVLDGHDLFDESWGEVSWEPRVKSGVSTYVGLWAGYRGYGIGYSRNVGRDKGSLLKFGAMGGSYGVNLRIHRFETDNPTVHTSGYMPEWNEETREFWLFDPIRVRALSLDGYYLFNGKKFSYAAAYDQSVIQKRSAGSLMVGAMYYHSTVAYDDGLNADLILLMNDIGKLKQYQVSVGGGYAYNFVPCKGLLINAMAMPMLVFYNRFDAWRYNSNLREKVMEMRQNPSASDSDEWDIDMEDFKIYPMEKDHRVTYHGKVSFLLDARLSVICNLGDWFVNAYGQLNNFRFRHEDIKGSLTDWYVNASVGLRL